MPVLRKLWLLFAQAATLCLAALFVVATLRPELLGQTAEQEGRVVLLQETSTPVTAHKITSFADAAIKASPAVVNIFTSKEMRQRTRCSTTKRCVAISPTSHSGCRASARRARLKGS
jgi:hypothetical protein